MAVLDVRCVMLLQAIMTTAYISFVSLCAR